MFDIDNIVERGQETFSSIANALDRWEQHAREEDALGTMWLATHSSNAGRLAELDHLRSIGKFGRSGGFL